MAIKDLNSKLERLTSSNQSNWKKKAKDRLSSKSWLKHSRKIAIKINIFLKENKIKQKDLAELLGVSPQQVSKIIKGKENLTLETISKIENVLKIQLLEVSKQRSNNLNIQKDFGYKKPSFKQNEYKMTPGKVIKVDFKRNEEMIYDSKKA
ncbi:Helix-turn-helix [Lutibacter oricola]|uniref:Helix-turn-helix n=1 Tax=Lutibacter oricola TaxID=762486 RepID=A0A1H3GT70_9FLAO|nr:helix-turn-helix transcriptional regulator [Lutibacter oricola]SDY06513.1 Helix-turn-helix [Lutibacter oricola]